MPDTVALDAIPLPDASVTTEEQSPGLIALMSPQAGRVLLTNDVGLLVLDHCDGERTVADLVTAVRDSYPDVAEDAAQRDVTRFLSEAAEKGVLSWA